MIEDLSHGHQIANLVSTGLMVGLFFGACVYGSLTEKRVDKPAHRPRPRPKSNAHLAGVSLPPVPKKNQEEIAA